MTQYRKFHVKATESLDINDMPDDFTRLLWVMLPLGLDREGRGLDNPSWVKAKIMPLRTDVTLEMVIAALEWFASRNMLIRYEVAGRHYFYIPTFKTYQGDTSREAMSSFPPPPDAIQVESDSTPDQVSTDSRPTPDLLVSESCLNADTDSEVDSDAEAVGGPEATPKIDDPGDIRVSTPAAPVFSPGSLIVPMLSRAIGIVAIPPKEYERVEQLHSLIDNYGPERVEVAIKTAYRRWISTKRKNGGDHYSSLNFGWVDWAQVLLMGDKLPGEKDPSQMTDKEFIAHMVKKAEGK